MARTSSGEAATRWATALVVAALCVLPVIGMALGQFIDGRENVAAQCAMNPPPAAGPDYFGENSLREASVTSLPAGRHCSFQSADGKEITTQTGWSASIAGIGATIAAIVLSCCAMRMRGERSALVTLLPLIGVALTWLIVISSAHSSTV